jgi:hypothetical protein
LADFAIWNKVEPIRNGPRFFALADALAVSLEAFTEPPAAHGKATPGRPAKAKPEAKAAGPVQKRGRPKKEA